MYAAIDKLIDPYAAGIYRKMLKNELEYAENELCKHSSAYTLDASTGTVRSSIVLQTCNLGGPGYIPIQLTTDKGSEVGWFYAFMSKLRDVYAADIDMNLYPFHVLIESIHNTVIEVFGRQLKEKLGLNLKDFLLRGKEAINELRQQLTEEEGPQENYQTWPGLTPDFNIYATDVYSRIGEPELTLASGWDVFVEIARQIAVNTP
ncbi:hypothetical protein C8R45DRAFT_923430 [Mycena sanguinolenta]|nr:hypothetical protein C8R45DRAFT_923430 [Mycena sanguinolenta]